MAAHFILQASGAMQKKLNPESWGFMFSVFVTDEGGTPIEGLDKNSFSVWNLTWAAKENIYTIELNSALPSSGMPGIYIVHTFGELAIDNPAPLEFLFALRVREINKEEKSPRQGFTTVAITYLGDQQ